MTKTLSIAPTPIAMLLSYEEMMFISTLESFKHVVYIWL